MTIRCSNCGPCNDSHCPCSKCYHVRGKQNKIVQRKVKSASRAFKRFKEDEVEF